MKIEDIDGEAAIDSVRTLLREEKDLSPALRSSLEVLMVLVTLLLNRITLNSRNSSKPPAMDPNREKLSRRGKGDRKPGGQPGHNGTVLEQVADPDAVAELKIDRRTLPKGPVYREAGYERRQVIDIDLSRFVTEYRAQILEDDEGNRFVAAFPAGVNRPVQYGLGVKANAVYMSQYQLIPYDRIRDHFQDQLAVPVSVGSVFNFNNEAYERLERFERWAKTELAESMLMHADETGVNIGGTRHWLHCASNAAVTWFYPHAKRGAEAMDEMGILPFFNGVLCHDHWKPYYQYKCIHALCNAHHLRELERAWEQDHQQWAKEMQALLIDIAKAVEDAGGWLVPNEAERWRRRYRKLLVKAEIECPPPDESQRNGKRGRLKRSKARNLLERLRDFEPDVLRFMEEERIPFTNNQGENDLRMTKVQQKISGCFRSMEGAKIFCRVRSYLSTCRKQGVSATQALTLLFQGRDPEFMDRKGNSAAVCAE
ncbi:MAG: IS66 family transposase [Gammaproteobacteria bacterium]|nr:IS66 family transposase [Gammaproteobacteria bacterium]MCB1882149.1 IS66 family transposase [Gammaproteobacteria bacterium]